jgi:hypothetical protein
VLFRNLHADAYTDSDTVGVTVGGGSNPDKNNVVISGSDSANAPIVSITRGPLFTSTEESKGVLPVVSINPLPANEALTSVGAAPNDGFFTPAQYRGAFSATDNWLQDWTAVDAYGMLVATTPPCEVAEVDAKPEPLKLLREESEEVTVTLTCGDGSPSADKLVTVEVKGGKKRVNVTPANALTNENGQATFTITATTKTGDAKVQFKHQNLNDNVTVKVKKK